MYNKGVAVPCVLVVDKFKVYIYYKDHLPPHIHVIGAGIEIKFLIKNTECIYARNISLREITKLRKILQSYQEFFQEKWHEYQDKN